MSQQLYWKYQAIARRTFELFRGKDFSVNQIRKYGLERFLENSNSLGDMINDLKNEGLIEKVGTEKATHRAAKGRKVSVWRWTRKGILKFGGFR